MDVISTKWEVESLEISPAGSNNVTNVVLSVNWKLTAYWEGYSYSIRDTSQISEGTYSLESPFVEFKNLTESQVIGWVHSGLGYDQVLSLENQAKNQIRSDIFDIPSISSSPIIVSPPWNSANT